MAFSVPNLLLISLTFLGTFLIRLPTSSANLYENSDNVKTLENPAVLHGDGIWMVQFFSPTSERCKNLVIEYKAVADITAGVFNIAVVDTTTDVGRNIANKYDIVSSPTIVMFGDGKNKKEYNGEGNAQDMIQNLMEFAIQTMQARAGGDPSRNSRQGGSSSSSSSSSKVKTITLANFQSEVLDSPMVSMIAFTAPWCGHCKKLYPDFVVAARKLEGEDAFLGWVDATEETELASMYNVQGYPTIKLFKGGEGKTFNSAIDYNGGRTITDIVSAVLAEVDRSGVPKPMPELISPQVMEEECSGQNHICVLAALPHILDSGASGRNNYKDVISKVAKSFRGTAFSFLWFEGTSQPELEQAFELTFGYPAIVAYSMGREAYAVMRSSFNEKAISTFLHGVTSGRQPTVKLLQLPTVLTTDPWDGKDGEVIEEEEFDLAELMGWDDDDEDGEKKEGDGEL